MSHQTQNQYIVSGEQREFDIAIPYLHRSHVKVFVNGAEHFYDWINDSRIRLTFPAQNGSVVAIRRETPISNPLVEFHNGSNLTKEELNTAVLQLLYKQQELADLYSGALDRAQVRLGDQLGVVTTPDAIMDELLLVSEFGDDLLNRFRETLADIDLNGEQIIDHSFKLTNQAFRMDNLTAVVDALANLEDGTGLATVIQNEAQERLDGDTALANTLALIGAKSADNTAFILDTNKVKASPTETLAQRFNAIYAANQNALGLIQSEQNARVSAIEAVTQRLDTQGSRIGANEAAIANETTTRTNAISAEAQARSALTAKVAQDIAAAISAESKARSDAVSAEASQRQQLATQVGNNWSAFQNEVTARTTATNTLASTLAILGGRTPDGGAFVLDTSRVQVGGGQSLATRLTGIDSQVGQNRSSIAEEITARANADSSLAQSIQAVSSTVGNHTTTITTLNQSVNGIYGRAGVVINNNGHLTGWTLNNDGRSGSFAVAAEYFSVVSPSNGNFLTWQDGRLWNRGSAQSVILGQNFGQTNDILMWIGRTPNSPTSVTAGEASFYVNNRGDVGFTGVIRGSIIGSSALELGSGPIEVRHAI